MYYLLSYPGTAGQPDYSTQWVEYYRSMGMVREAEAIEQQAKGAKPAQPAPAIAPAQPTQPQQQGSVSSNGELLCYNRE